MTLGSTASTRCAFAGSSPRRAEAVSLVLDVPADLAAAFAYRAGQFLTFRLTIDGRRVLRSYSMSSSPEVDGELQVTVKRVAGGARLELDRRLARRR